LDSTLIRIGFRRGGHITLRKTVSRLQIDDDDDDDNDEDDSDYEDDEAKLP